MDLTLNVYSDSPDYTVVAVGGEIDVYSAPKLREKLISLVESGSYHLIIDMEAVEFLDSTGLGVLVGGLKRVRAHDGWIDLVCTQGRILRIFRITGLSRVFNIYDSVVDAIAAHEAPPAADEHRGHRPGRVEPGKIQSRSQASSRTDRWFQPPPETRRPFRR